LPDLAWLFGLAALRLVPARLPLAQRPASPGARRPGCAAKAISRSEPVLIDQRLPADGKAL